ncbi:MAG: hypothetical protein WCG93_14215 [Paludibacter sp.]
MKPMTKSDEIALLTELVKGNGYFAESFKDDLETMVSNIKNDFPIVHKIELSNEIDSLNRALDANEYETDSRLKVVASKVQAEKDSLLECMLLQAHETSNERLYERVLEEIGIAALIRWKHLLCIPMNNDEMKFLISKI